MAAFPVESRWRSKRLCTVPTAFDGNYKAKPAYWAYVDATKLQPAIQKVTITEAKDGNIAGETYTIDQGAVQAEFIPVWDADGLTVQVKVKIQP